jgi:outer membrane protein assembly factor BamE (lipoprotein component of BamABCDE complex)
MRVAEQRSGRAPGAGRAAIVAALLLLAACATELGSLTPEQAATVRVGQSREEVRAALGDPVSTSTARRGQQEVWTYRLYDRGNVQRHQLVFVHFGSDTGDVVRIERASDPAFGGDMSRTVPRRAVE